MKLNDFRQSNWIKAAKAPGAESRVKAAFPKWKNRVKNLNLVSRAEELWGYLISDRCSAGDKLLVMGALIYLISPIDLIPDYIPVIGWMDDLGVATAVLAFLNGKLDEAAEIQNTDADFVRQCSEQRQAEDDPFRDLLARSATGIGDDPYRGLSRNSRIGHDPFADLLGEPPTRK